MIARCPECQTRFRLAREKIGPQGARIRCSRCSTIFRVEAPDEVPSAAEIAQPAPPPAPPLARAVVAEADAEIAKAIADLLERHRIRAEIVPDGGEALLRIFRSLPELAILGGHLPGIQAPAIAEIIRRSTDTQEMSLIRVAPMDEPAGAPEFDADETLEPGDLPDGIAALLESLQIGEAPAAAPPRPAPTPTPTPTPRGAPTPPAPPAVPTPQPSVVAPPAPAPAPEAAPPPTPAATPTRRSRRSPPLSADPEIAAAERLSRIAVSDIILYNEEKFASAAESDDPAGVFKAELAEARAMFDGRIPEKVRADRDFLTEELLRRITLKRDGA